MGKKLIFFLFSLVTKQCEKKKLMNYFFFLFSLLEKTQKTKTVLQTDTGGLV